MHRDAPRAFPITAVLIGLGALLLLVVGATTYSALALPGCVSCHDDTELVSATAEAPHADVACTSCHVGDAPGDRASFGFRQVFHMTVPLVSGEGRGWESVPDHRCVTCHDDVYDDVTGEGIRIAHLTCAEGSDCTDCHSATAHGAATTWVRTYDMDTCLDCHVSQNLTDCDLCHEGRRPDDRITTGVFSITHGPSWEQTHGMGDAANCTACHTAAACERCHGAGLPHEADFISEHSEIAQLDNAQCESCHEPRFCDDCHGLEMPHTDAFTRGHAEAAVTNEDLCRRCHADPDCTECHVTHVHPGGAIGTLREEGE